MNLSIHTGKLPKDLKSARVVPLHKKDSKTQVGNYRPVSILSMLSKVFERLVYNQLEEYLLKHKILPKYYKISTILVSEQFTLQTRVSSIFLII